MAVFGASAEPVHRPRGWLGSLIGCWLAAAPVIAKYTGVLAAADVEAFTRTATFTILQSMRLDLGPSSPLHA
jgi:hypothetical protein